MEPLNPVSVICKILKIQCIGIIHNQEHLSFNTQLRIRACVAKARAKAFAGCDIA